MASPLKAKQPSRENKSLSKKDNGKSERWNVIEEKLKIIRNEN
jgi:hypothetical protein